MADADDAAAAMGVETSASDALSPLQLEAQAQAIMEGLSRLERTVDDAGYAFTALDAPDRDLVTLDALRSYPHLQFVNVARNRLSDVAVLSELPYLVAANLSWNALATPPALGNAYLQSLDVSMNQLTTLEGLTSTSLTSLRINDNQLESVAGLANVPALTILEAARNAIADLSAFASDSKLELLDVSENKLLSLAGIEALTSLQSLSARQNNLDSMDAIDTLTTLPHLSELDLSLNPVVDTDNYRLKMIMLMPQLKKLDGELIRDDERLAAVDLKQQQLAEAAAAAAAEADAS